MKKLIVFKNGKKSTMNIEEVLYEFRGLACKTFLMITGNKVVTEDDKQELDVVIFKTFQTYDEKHCFSTHLVWNVRKYISHQSTNSACRKRNKKDYEILDLDYCVAEEGSMKLHELICDEKVNIENDYVNKELLCYLKKQFNDIEMQLLSMNLGTLSLTHLAMKMNKSPQNINNMNARFKKKLLKLMGKYYKKDLAYAS